MYAKAFTPFGRDARAGFARGTAILGVSPLVEAGSGFPLQVLTAYPARRQAASGCGLSTAILNARFRFRNNVCGVLTFYNVWMRFELSLERACAWGEIILLPPC